METQNGSKPDFWPGDFWFTFFFFLRYGPLNLHREATRTFCNDLHRYWDIYPTACIGRLCTTRVGVAACTLTWWRLPNLLQLLCREPASIVGLQVIGEFPFFCPCSLEITLSWGKKFVEFLGALFIWARKMGQNSSLMAGVVDSRLWISYGTKPAMFSAHALRKWEWSRARMFVTTFTVFALNSNVGNRLDFMALLCFSA